MTYQNDPHNRTPVRNTNYGWIIGGLVAVAVMFGIFAMYRHNNNYTSPVAERGTVTSPTTVRPAVPPPLARLLRTCRLLLRSRLGSQRISSKSPVPKGAGFCFS